MTDFPFASMLVSGPDTRTFLQGQLTCDIDTLTREKPLLACVNSAQGRVQAVLDVIERDAGIVLSVAASMAERTAQRLRKYVLRSKVKIEVLPVPVSESFFRVPSPASPALLSQIGAGIPHVFPETHEAFVAQMLNLDALGGISFEKGCYTGQEIIARAHYRGAVKRRMFRYSAGCEPPAPGTRLQADQEHAGEVVYAAANESGCEMLAVVNLPQSGKTLTLNGGQVALTRLDLPYAVGSA